METIAKPADTKAKPGIAGAKLRETESKQKSSWNPKFSSTCARIQIIFPAAAGDPAKRGRRRGIAGVDRLHGRHHNPEFHSSQENVPKTRDISVKFSETYGSRRGSNAAGPREAALRNANYRREVARMVSPQASASGLRGGRSFPPHRGQEWRSLRHSLLPGSPWRKTPCSARWH